MKTWKSATYQPGTVKAWATDVKARTLEVLAASTMPKLEPAEFWLDTLFSYEMEKKAATGDAPLDTGLERPRRIIRDSTRGTEVKSGKGLQDAEDAACLAGMRNPAKVLQAWPALAEDMKPVRKALLQAIAWYPDLQDLPKAVGTNPVRQPPGLESIAKAREGVAKALG